MHTFAENQKRSQKTKVANPTTPDRTFFGLNPAQRSPLPFQRTIGNSAVQRLLQTNDKELNEGSARSASTRFAHDFSRIPLHTKAHADVQPKLMNSIPRDIFAQEADRVAGLSPTSSWSGRGWRCGHTNQKKNSETS